MQTDTLGGDHCGTVAILDAGALEPPLRSLVEEPEILRVLGQRLLRSASDCCDAVRSYIG